MLQTENLDQILASWSMLLSELYIGQASVTLQWHNMAHDKSAMWIFLESPNVGNTKADGFVGCLSSRSLSKPVGYATGVLYLTMQSTETHQGAQQL